MKIIICICTYKRNEELVKCLKKFENIFIPGNIKINFLVLDNSINFSSKTLIGKFKKKFKFPLIQINEKKRGVVNARNRCLKEVKNINCEYIAFFDDDCVIDNKWFINFYELIKKNNIEILTGPQIHNNKSANLFEKNYKQNFIEVKWAATNNVIIKKKILIKEKILFDPALNKFGMGEDQLFFSKLRKKGYKIFWSKNLRVVEKSHSHRLGINWIINRSYRLGIIGCYIDKNLYGVIFGSFINYLKLFIYFFSGLLFLLKIDKSTNLIFRSFGRFLGPFVFKKIDFFKK